MIEIRIYSYWTINLFEYNGSAETLDNNKFPLVFDSKTLKYKIRKIYTSNKI